MKILFLLSSKTVPSGRVRVMDLLPELTARGIQPMVEEYPRRFGTKFSLFSSLKFYDVVFLQKKLPSAFDLFLLKNLSAKLIYDFDDAVYQNQHSEDAQSGNSRSKKFKRTILGSDLIIAGNRILAEEAVRHNPRVVIIPSAVKATNLPVKDQGFPGGKTIIGWVGTPGNLPYLKLLEPVFARLSKEHSIEVKIISSTSVPLDGVETRFIPWSLETQEKEIASLDIGVMPLPDTVHTRGKCGYKALQYMAAKVPPVVSDVGVNREIVEDGHSGLVAGAIEDFYGHLKYLIENPGARHQIGENAAARVRNTYSVEVVGELLSNTVAGLGEAKR